MASKSLRFQIEVQLPPNRTKASFTAALEEAKTAFGTTLTEEAGQLPPYHKAN